MATCALAIAFLVLICCAGIIYWRPIGVVEASARAWLRLTGVRSKYVQLGPFRVHYLVGGHGPPLVLVHGMDGRAENWVRLLPSLMWQGHQVYAIDLLGFGRSDRPDIDYSIASQVEILHSFFQSQGLVSADLGGWSMGGWVALRFTLDHPECVRRVFVADSLGVDFELPFEPALFQASTVDEAHRLLALLSPLGTLSPRFLARDVVRRLRPTKWIVQRAIESMISGGDLLDNKLGAIRAPVLIVWGKQDALIPLICAEKMHRQMPHSRLAIFDGCGHLAPAECSGRMLPEILQFLEAEPPLPPAVREYAR